jgi:hypothetical protein
LFIIDDAVPGPDMLIVLAYGYNDWSRDIIIANGVVENLGDIQIEPVSFESAQALEFRNAIADMALSESQLEDEEGNTQEVALLSGATDHPFYQASSYTFSTARFRIRGYENNKTETYINGVPFNDAIRFSFNYSMTGGLNQAFRNKTIGMGLEDNAYGFGGIGGANNIKTFAADYAPGDRMWLKVYVVGALSHEPQSESLYAYVELTAPDGTLTARAKLLCRDGIYAVRHWAVTVKLLQSL